MKTILIDCYPATMTFNVRKDLPEFDEYCEVRQEILLRQLRRQKVDSPCHGYSEYVVEDVIPFEGGEEWIIGS